MPICERHSKTAGDGTWEQVVAPFNCSYYSISGPIVDNSQVLFGKCCDPNDPAGCIYGLSNFAVTAPPLALAGPDLPSHRWTKGEVITYVKSSAPLSIYFLR